MDLYKSRQVLGKGGEILCLENFDGQGQGQGEEDKLQLNSCEAVFCVDLSQDDGHLGGYSHDSCSSAQGCHVGRRKRRIKGGTENHEGRCLPSDPSPRNSCVLADSPGPAT